MTAHWRGIIGFEGVPATDGRRIDPDGVAWDLPVILRDAESADQIGTIDSIERRPDGALIASGTTVVNLLEGEGLAMSIDLADATAIGGAVVLRSGRLRYVYTTQDPAWLEARVLGVAV